MLDAIFFKIQTVLERVNERNEHEFILVTHIDYVITRGYTICLD